MIPRRSWTPARSRRSWDRARRRRRPITIEGMPIGLFENELTVQLWQPVTIRGYTFNIADKVTLDQTKIKKTPAVGGDSPCCSRLTRRNDRQNVRIVLEWLPPPLLREATKVQTPWLTAFRKNPHIIRPATQFGCLDSTVGKTRKAPRRETDQLAIYSAARDRTEFPYQGRRAEPQLPDRANKCLSRLPRGRLANHEQSDVALSSVPCDRQVQANRRRSAVVGARRIQGHPRRRHQRDRRRGRRRGRRRRRRDGRHQQPAGHRRRRLVA